MNQNRSMLILPQKAYTSQEWFDKEQNIIFGNLWQFAGLVEDIQEPGDYITVQCGFQNIVVMKRGDQRRRELKKSFVWINYYCQTWRKYCSNFSRYCTKMDE